MTEAALASLKTFVGLANPNGLSISDWERLSDFIIQCHRDGEWPLVDELAPQHLKAFDTKVATEVAMFVSVSQILLTRYDG